MTDDETLAYLRSLPLGQRPAVDPDGLVGWSIFPFELEGLRTRTLQGPELPEPPRAGEDGPATCPTCQDGESAAIWADGDWLVLPAGEPTAIPTVVTLNPRAHHDLGDLPEALSRDLGPLLQRLERAVMTVPGTGRVHLNKWGDGGAHLHVFAFARPAGMQQLRGSCLVLWQDLLPALDQATWDRNLGIVADAMAEGGGVALR